MNNIIYSEYYNKTFDINIIKQALNLYKIFCAENSLKPEVDDVDDVNNINIDHILYHAEMKGMKL